MKNSKIHIGPGASSLILILVLLAMSVMGMLTFISSRNDLRLSLRSMEVAEDVCELNERAEETYAAIAAALGRITADPGADGQEIGDRLAESLKEASPDLEFEISGQTVSWTQTDGSRELDCTVKWETGSKEQGEDILSVSWSRHRMSGVSAGLEDDWGW